MFKNYVHVGVHIYVDTYHLLVFILKIQNTKNPHKNVVFYNYT